MWQIVPYRIPKQHVWYWFPFSTKKFPEQFGWADREWSKFAALFLKSVLSEYAKVWSGVLLSTALWVLITVLRNKTKKAKNWAKPGKQRGCHNFYRARRALASLYNVEKPFLIALTLIHKLQDIFTFVVVSVILPCLRERSLIIGVGRAGQISQRRAQKY